MSAQRVGERLLTLILLTFIFSAFMIAYRGSQMGSVTVLVRSDDGGRGLYTVSLSTGALTKTDLSGQVITGNKKFLMTDGSTIELGSAGVIRRGQQDTFDVLVASPVPPTARTPLAVWDDGARIAWINPADGSVQVYEKTPRGTYLPLQIEVTLHPNSFEFSNDGSMLILAKFSGSTTDFYSLAFATGETKKLTSIPGLATITDTP